MPITRFSFGDFSIFSVYFLPFFLKTVGLAVVVVDAAFFFFFFAAHSAESFQRDFYFFFFINFKKYEHEVEKLKRHFSNNSKRQRARCTMLYSCG
jgi:hypothetical protein